MPDPKCVLCQRRIRKGRAPPLTGQYAGLCKKCIRQATRARQPLGAADSNSESDSAGSESDCESAWSESGSGSESDGSSGARPRPPKFSISPQEQQDLEKVGGTGGRHNPSREIVAPTDPADLLQILLFLRRDRKIGRARPCSRRPVGLRP